MILPANLIEWVIVFCSAIETPLDAKWYTRTNSFGWIRRTHCKTLAPTASTKCLEQLRPKWFSENCLFLEIQFTGLFLRNYSSLTFYCSVPMLALRMSRLGDSSVKFSLDGVHTGTVYNYNSPYTESIGVMGVDSHCGFYTLLWWPKMLADS